MASVEELLDLVTPPRKISHTVDWRSIKRGLGVQLPGDYRDLVSNYGPGVFDDFLGVLVPNAPIEYADIVTQQPAFKTGLEALKNVDPSAVPHNIADLTACAATSNGDIICWIGSRDEDPNAWSIGISAPRDGLWEEYQGTLTDFLCAIFSRGYSSSIFPKAFPNANGSTFVPFDAK